MEQDTSDSCTRRYVSKAASFLHSEESQGNDCLHVDTLQRVSVTTVFAVDAEALADDQKLAEKHRERMQP